MSLSNEKPHVRNRHQYEALRKNGMSPENAAELANADRGGHNAAPSPSSQRRRIAARNPSPNTDEARQDGRD